MKKDLLTYIALFTAVASLAAAGYLYKEYEGLKTVTNTQGQVLQLMIKTPEIGAILLREIRSAASSTTESTTTE